MADIPRFTEREPYEKRFAEIFARHIAPQLVDLENERLGIFRKQQKRKVDTIRITMSLAVLGAVVVLVMIWVDLPTDYSGGVAIFFIFAMVIVYIIGYYAMLNMAEGYAESLRDIVAPAICEFFGDLDYVREPGERFDNKRFQNLGLVPGGRWSRFEDLFVGRYHDIEFKMVDGRAISGHKETSRTEFNGLLFEIVVPLEFDGRVIIGRDKGRIDNALKGFFGGKFGEEKCIQFPDTAFEKHFTVYASDADEAMKLVSPGFCENMLALVDTYSVKVGSVHLRKSLSAAFIDGAMLLALPLPGNRFEPGSVEKTVYDCEDGIHDFLKDIKIAHRVIDYLRGERPAQAHLEA